MTCKKNESGEDSVNLIETSAVPAGEPKSGVNNVKYTLDLLTSFDNDLEVDEQIETSQDPFATPIMEVRYHFLRQAIAVNSV